MGGFVGAIDDVVLLAYRTRELHPEKYVSLPYDPNSGKRSGARQITSDNLGRYGISWSELDWSDGALLGTPPITYGMRSRPRGDFLSNTVGWAVGLTTTLMGGFLLAPALRFAAPLLGGPGSRAASMILTSYGALGLGTFAARAVRSFSSLDREVRRIRQGGDYQDTASAQALRSAAVRDMSSAFGASRRFLGREATYLH